jgi:hypothetical protein
MRVIALSVVAAYAVGCAFHLFRDSVPAYDKWGAHSDLCGTTGPHKGSDEVEDPLAAFTSLLFFVAALDNDAAVVYGALLAAASFALHSYETEGARELDFYVAAAAPLVVAVIAIPAAAALALGVVLVLQYEAGLARGAVAATGLAVGALTLWRRGASLRDLAPLVVAGAAAAVLIGGDRNTAICNNDRMLAFAYDARHGGWHVATAVVLWEALGLFTNLGKRAHGLWLAVAAAIPAVAALVDRADVYPEAWITTTAASALAFAYVALRPESPTYTLVIVSI